MGRGAVKCRCATDAIIQRRAVRSRAGDLNSPEGQDQYLFAGLAFAAERLGIIPSESQVLSFKVPPVLGGAMSTENIDASDFVVSLNIVGQIHQQIKDLPPGTPISGFTVDGQRP